MAKVNSAIKSLECVDISQVNVKEDTEVAHSGHGHSYVKKKKLMFQRILKNRFKMIAQKATRKIANLPSIPILFLKERERAARPAVMEHPQHLKRERR